MTITTCDQLAKELALAPTGIYQREMLKKVTLHEQDGHRTVCELSVRHSSQSKAILANIRIIGIHPRDGYSVITWHPMDEDRNRRMGVVACSRYSNKALNEAMENTLVDLLEDPNGWLHNLNLTPITEQD